MEIINDEMRKIHLVQKEWGKRAPLLLEQIKSEVNKKFKLESKN